MQEAKTSSENQRVRWQKGNAGVWKIPNGRIIQKLPTVSWLERSVQTGHRPRVRAKQAL